jgi:molecular chaperone GrpE
MSEQDASDPEGESEEPTDSEETTNVDADASGADAGDAGSNDAADETSAAADETSAGADDSAEAADQSGDAAGRSSRAVDVEVDETLREHVEAADDDDLARELAELRHRVDDREAELADARAEAEDLESRLKRKQADFQNYKKRMEKRREEEKQRATEDLVERLLDVRDNLQRALETDEDADIRDGVETTLRQFDRVLDAENVVRIDPDSGEDVDPQRHEVLMRVASDREPGTIDEVHRPGYEMADKVLRPAQVTVAEEADDADYCDRDDGASEE